jgi:hypothetical protein
MPANWLLVQIQNPEWGMLQGTYTRRGNVWGRQRLRIGSTVYAAKIAFLGGRTYEVAFSDGNKAQYARGDVHPNAVDLSGVEWRPRAGGPPWTWLLVTNA